MTAHLEQQLAPLPSAEEAKEKLAMQRAAKVNEYARAQAAEVEEKNRLIEKLMEPSGVSDDEALRKVAAIVDRAIANGVSEVMVYRFPNHLCTDRARAISQSEPGWEDTLRGVSAEIYSLWRRRLRPLGYKIRFEIVEWPRGMPGDVGITLRWG
jgi:hypothetical protein